jgi:acetyl-CoA acetyltransferase family protein
VTRDLTRPLREPWVVAAVRTPIGRYGGALAQIRPDDLAAAAIRCVVDKSGIDPALIEDVILGCANQAGEDNRDVARMALLLAGLPIEVGGLTVNRLCGSGLQAVNSAAHAIAVGDGDVFIGGGVESMTRAPYVMAKPASAWDRGPRELQDTTLGWRFLNPRLAEMHYPYSMGETAENVAERWNVERDRQDQFAMDSHRKAVAAIEAGRFDDQIVPIPVPQQKGPPTIVDRDEHPRADSSLEALAGLKPAFRDGGTVTAGNSTGINDGASAVLLVEAGRARELGLKPMTRIVSTAIAGVDPAIMGYGPVPATRKAGRSFARASMEVSARGCSSRVTTIGSPFFCGMVTGTISPSKKPLFCAATALSCEASAMRSCASRSIL